MVTTIPSKQPDSEGRAQDVDGRRHGARRPLDADGPDARWRYQLSRGGRVLLGHFETYPRASRRAGVRLAVRRAVCLGVRLGLIVHRMTAQVSRLVVRTAVRLRSARGASSADRDALAVTFVVRRSCAPRASAQAWCVWCASTRWAVVTFLVRLVSTIAGMSMCCPISRRARYLPVPGRWWA